MNVFRWTALSACCNLVGGCTYEVADGDIAELRADVTLGSPVVDVEFVAEISPPSGMTYKDLAIGVNIADVYLLRSDGKIEHRNGQYPGELWGVRPYSGISAIDWADPVPGIEYGLIAAQDSTRTITRALHNHVCCGREDMGSYPAGVTQVTDIAVVDDRPFGTPYPGHHIRRLYIIHWSGSTRVLRGGTYDHTLVPHRITWDAQTLDVGDNLQDGLTHGVALPTPESIGEVKLFAGRWASQRARFQWWDTYNGMAYGIEGYGFTDHAYLHPEGALDTFAPRGIGYGIGYFYGIDVYSNLGRDAWVIARLPRTKIRF